MDKVLAVIWLRFKIFRHSLRGGKGVIDIVAAVIMLALGAVVSLGLAFGFGAFLHFAINAQEPGTLRFGLYVLFFSLVFFGVILPVIRGVGNEGADSSRFLTFPIKGGTLFMITFLASFGNGFHLFYYPTLLAVLIMGVVLPGTAIPLGMLILLLILICYVAWNHAITLIFQSIMRKRKVKEIIAIVSFMGLVAFGVGPSVVQSLIENKTIESLPETVSSLQAAAEAGKGLPPALAAEAIFALHQQRTSFVLQCAFWLILWDGAGLMLGYWIFRKYHLQERGPKFKISKQTNPLEKTAPHSEAALLDLSRLAFLPMPLVAVATKEMRYIFRSTIGKFNLLMMPVLVIIAVFIFASQVSRSFLGIDPTNLIFLSLLLYAVFLSNNITNNAFAWDGAGMKSYFMSPVKLKWVLAGKNAALWLYNVLVFVICVVIWVLLVHLPDAFTLLTGLLIFAISLLACTTAGNLVSILFPVKRNISSMKTSPSQAGVFFSLASMIINVAVLSLFMFIPILMGRPHYQPLFLAVLLAIVTGIYLAVLNLSARLLDERMEKLIDALKGND